MFSAFNGEQGELQIHPALVEQDPTPESDIFDDGSVSGVVAAYPGRVEVHSSAKAEPVADTDVAASANGRGKSGFAGLQRKGDNGARHREGSVAMR